MQVGSLEQQVEVKAAALAIETTATLLGEAINARKLVSLPLNARSYMDLLGLSSGNISINGQRETADAFLVNGGYPHQCRKP